MVEKKNNGKEKKPKDEQAAMQQSLTRPEVTDFIAERLRNFYDGVAKQPVPDRFVELLKKLETSGLPEEKKSKD